MYQIVKLDDKAEKFHFVGYSKNPKGYRQYDERSDKVVTRRDVIFDENNFSIDPMSKSNDNLELLVSPTEFSEMTEGVAEPQHTRSG